MLFLPCLSLPCLFACSPPVLLRMTPCSAAHSSLVHSPCSLLARSSISSTGAPYGASDGTTPGNMDMMVESQDILGDFMIGIECGNEPDQYNFNGRTVRNVSYNSNPLHRHFFVTLFSSTDRLIDSPFFHQSSYDQGVYANEFGQFIAQVNANDSITRKNLLLGPGISNQWSPDSVWDTGYLDRYNTSLAAIVVER
jgi:hypothetical protein